MILPVMACVALHAWDSSYSYEFNFVVLPMKNMTPSPTKKRRDCHSYHLLVLALCTFLNIEFTFHTIGFYFLWLSYWVLTR
jgi:hypothetical protein